MTAGKVPVVGGPHDGLEVRRRNLFAWINAGGTVSLAAHESRTLYRLTKLKVWRRGKSAVRTVYLMAAHAWEPCSCGGYYRRAEGGLESIPCPLCRSVPKPAKAKRA